MGNDVATDLPPRAAGPDTSQDKRLGARGSPLRVKALRVPMQRVAAKGGVGLGETEVSLAQRQVKVSLRIDAARSSYDCPEGVQRGTSPAKNPAIPLQ